MINNKLSINLPDLAKEPVSLKGLQKLLTVRLKNSHSVTDIESVIKKTCREYHDSRNDEVVDNLISGMYSPETRSLLEKKNYVLKEFPKYFILQE